MKSLINFLFELTMLKRLPRAGSFLAGIKHPDTIAEHVFRTTQLAFIIAELEGGNSLHASWLASIHDNAECRLGDLNRVMQKYITNKKEIEMLAFQDQVEHLPESLRKKYIAGFIETEEGITLEAKCVKDADYLEMALQAKMHLEQGIECMQDWINNVEKALQTNTAKKMFTAIIQSNSWDWWKGVKKEI